jgi:hypothetical protein
MGQNPGGELVELVLGFGTREAMQHQADSAARLFRQVWITDGQGELYSVVKDNIGGLAERLATNAEDRLAERQAEAGGEVASALLRLYHLHDGDEAAVGEQMYEIDKAARRAYRDEMEGG